MSLTMADVKRAQFIGMVLGFKQTVFMSVNRDGQPAKTTPAHGKRSRPKVIERRQEKQ